MPKRTHELKINGQVMEDAHRRAILSPFDGKEVGQVAFGEPVHVESALATAEQAAPVMGRMPRHERAALLQRMAHILMGQKEDNARIIADEAGKPIRFASIEAARVVDTFMEAATVCAKLDGEVVPVDAVEGGAGRTGIVRRFGVGLVAGISPFNFPLNLAAHKVAPAIAAGCSMVLKPASQTPMSALALAAAADEAGLPPGALTVIPASREAANQLTVDERVKLLTFTGSAEVGWGMKARAGKKKVVLELGGNAAALVGPDADLEQVIPKLVTGSFAYAGQICISVQRILVLEPLYEAFLDGFVAATKQQAKTGDPLDPEVMVGPMIDHANHERIISWVDEARSAGARIHCGGEAAGTCVTPAVISEADPALQICAEEAFGPVVVLERVADWEQAIARTNDSRFGLQCGVFTNDLRALWRCFEGIEVGGVIHNDFPTFRVDLMPYGGVKDSGFGREGPRYAMEEMTEPRLLVINP